MKVSRRTGGYNLLAKVGQGGMGDVYAAMKDGPGGFGKLLALKVLRAGLVNNPEFLSMFLDEARITAHLNHPNVVQTYEVGNDDESYFIAMEFLDGQTLSKLIRSNNGANRREYFRLVLTVVSEALTGLHHAHDLKSFQGEPLGIVHRDATPQNIFVTYDGEVKVVDFGIAKALDSGVETVAGTFKGKLGYVPPEQLQGGTVDRRADAYSMGVVLFESLCGRRMFHGLSDGEIMKRLMEGDLPEVPPLPAELPSSLSGVVGRAIAADPGERYATAAQMRHDLDRVLAEMGGRMDRRKIGRHVCDGFSKEKERTRRALEDQIRQLGEYVDSSEARTPTGWRTIPTIGGQGQGGTHSGGSSKAGSLEQCETVNYNLPRVAKKKLGLRRLVAVASVLVVVVAGLLAGVFVFFDELSQMPLLAREVPKEQGREESESEAPQDPAANANGKQRVALSGEIQEDSVLTADKEYLLEYTTYVGYGATLYIQKGTTIYGDHRTSGTLVVRPGGRIVAQGTAKEPIVFTSSRPKGERKPGDWGGVIILGEAPTNITDSAGRKTRGHVEGITEGGEYGGDNPDDDSGVLTYVRIEYAGKEIAPNNEINGLTLAGVGRLTEINHVQVRNVLDDCFEFFGGTVDAKYLICRNPGDDGFDWDHGYTGRLQFLLMSGHGRADAKSAGFEGDNDPGGSDNRPVSSPTIFNATMCGKNESQAADHYGVLVKRNTAGRIANSIFTGFAAGVDVRNKGTRFSIEGSVFHDNLRANIAYPERKGRRGVHEDDDRGLDETEMILEEERGNSEMDPQIPGCIRRDRLEHKPAKPIVTGARIPPADGFFDPSAVFIGAFRNQGDNWDEGEWTRW